MSLAPKYFAVQSKEELQTENHLSTFVVVGLVNTEIFRRFIKLGFFLFRNKQANVSNLTLCFLGTFFGALIPVKWYEIRSGCGLEFSGKQKPFSKNWSTIFQLKVLRLKTHHFHTKQPYRKSMLRLTEQGLQNGPIIKKRNFASNYFIFVKRLFQFKNFL